MANIVLARIDERLIHGQRHLKPLQEVILR